MDSKTYDEILKNASLLPTEDQESFLYERLQDQPETVTRILDELRKKNWDDTPTIARDECEKEAAITKEVASSISKVGPFQVLRKLGEGGMGSVFLAEQKTPVVRQVALKVIRSNLSSNEVLSRFDAERQAAAQMAHPNVARFIDAGATDTGEPYFAMELVDGLEITEYCKRKRLGIEERLKLFIQVCNGVQHAHQKGIIHRDLKPSNVLVAEIDDVPVPKVIDFGLAKALGKTQLNTSGKETQFGQVIGTLKYMSPEQANLDHSVVDTRTDIYALGVMLYELLTGATPLAEPQLANEALMRVLEIIRDQEPIKPSSQLNNSDFQTTSQITDERRTDRQSLNRALEGDLDWIVMKAIEKDPVRRYESASGFAADISRYLRVEPVEARPPSLNYRLSKFIRKNRIGVLAGAVTFVGLMSGIIGTTLGMLAASQSADKAREAQTAAEQFSEELQVSLNAEKRAKESAEAIASYLKDDVLALTSVAGQVRFGEGSQLSRDSTLRDLLDRASNKIDQKPGLTSQTKAELHGIIGYSYQGVGEAQKAIFHLEKAYDLHTKMRGEKDSVAIKTLSSLASAFDMAGQSDRSFDKHLKAVALSSDLAPSTPARLLAMDGLANAFQLRADFKNALSTRQTVYELRKKHISPIAQDTILSLIAIGSIERELGDFDASRQTLNEAVKLVKENIPQDHPVRFAAMEELAETLMNAGESAEALSILTESRNSFESRLGPDHPETLESTNVLAMAMQQAGDPMGAAKLFEDSLKTVERKLGSAHPNALVFKANLALALLTAGRHIEALPLLESTLMLQREIQGDDHPDVIATLNNLGGAQMQAHDFRSAIASFESAYQLAVRIHGEEHFVSTRLLNNLAACYQEDQQIDKALELYLQVLEKVTKMFGPENDFTAMVSGNVAICYQAAGKKEDAIRMFKIVHQLSKKFPQVSGAGPKLISLYHSEDMATEASELTDELIREATEKSEATENPEIQTASALASVGSGLVEGAAFPYAVRVLKRVYELRKQHSPDDWSTFDSLSMLAEAKLRQTLEKQQGDAETELASSHQEIGASLQRAFEELEKRADQLPAPYRKQVLLEAVSRLQYWASITEQQDQIAKWQLTTNRIESSY